MNIINDFNNLKNKSFFTFLSIILILISVFILLIVLTGLFLCRDSLTIQNKLIWPSSTFLELQNTTKEGYLQLNGNAPKENCLIYYHGNAENVNHSSTRIRNLLTKFSKIYCIEYPGYSNICPLNNFEPKNFWNYIENVTTKIMKNILGYNQKIVLYGRSIGTGVVCQLLYNNEFIRNNTYKLILETPFASIKDIVIDKVGTLISEMFTDKLHWELNNKHNLENSNLDCSILILAGENDNLTPVSHAKILNHICKNSTLIIKKYGHNIPFNEIYNDIINFV